MNLQSIPRWLQITIDPYLRTVLFLRMTEIFAAPFENKIFFSSYGSFEIKFCRVLFWCSCKRKKQNCPKYNFKIRRNDISYLGNEFRIKKWHLLEQPDAIVKCSCDKFFEKKTTFFLQNNYWCKAWEKTRHLQFSHVNRFLKSSGFHYQFFSNPPFWMYVVHCQRRMWE